MIKPKVRWLFHAFWQFNWKFAKSEVEVFWVRLFVKKPQFYLNNVNRQPRGFEELDNLKPISSTEELYTIFAKALAKIHKKVANTILTENEVIDWRLKSFQIGVISKLDIEQV